VRRAKRRRRARLQGAEVDHSGRTELYAEVLSGDPCSYCGARADTIDHVDPVSRGGRHDWKNLTAACRRCNSRKSDRVLLDFLVQRLLELEPG
jgi:5-methylcytosine-specific restriction endonuclease McrA